MMLNIRPRAGASGTQGEGCPMRTGTNTRSAEGIGRVATARLCAHRRLIGSAPALAATGGPGTVNGPRAHDVASPKVEHCVALMECLGVDPDEMRVLILRAAVSRSEVPFLSLCGPKGILIQ